MTLTVEFPPEVEERLGQAARARGLQPDEYVREVVTESLPVPGRIPIANLFAQWEAEDATDDPAELAARQAEWEDLRANLEADRVSFRVPAL